MDLTAVAAAQQKETARQLFHYLQRHYSRMLHQLMVDAETLKQFITATRLQADQSGYATGELFSFFIISSFLSGTRWLEDPAYATLKMVLEDSVADSDITQQLHFCRHERQKLDAILPALHNSTIALLKSWPDRLVFESVLQRWQVLALDRGIPASSLLPLYRCYAGDFRQFAGLPLEHNEVKHVNAGIYGEIPVEEVALYSADLTPELRYLLLLHLHLALGFGRFYQTNPLHSILHQVLKSADPERPVALIPFLSMQRQRLMDNTGHRK
ncbi:hypothetical protein [Entomohabitans teleogrylli]|uniref:hypothetical protein n=1 Tax=Entomohabitans teleogrylli TaxID=1384589 RepID=UPI000AF57970|nr:hypothetical protein [Entomohabitans teleogrylli]